MCGHYCFNKYWLFLFQVQEQLDTINMDKIVIESLKEENSRVKREKEDVEGLLVQYRQFEVCVLGLDIIISLWWVIFITVSISISHIFVFPRTRWSQYHVTLEPPHHHGKTWWFSSLFTFLCYYKRICDILLLSNDSAMASWQRLCYFLINKHEIVAFVTNQPSR